MAYGKETREVISETSVPIVAGMFWYAILAVFLTGIGYGIYYFVAPAKVAIDNRVFHESQPYNDGMARDLENMQMQYLSASPEGRAAISATIQHRFAGYDASRLPANLQIFLMQVR